LGAAVVSAFLVAFVGLGGPRAAHAQLSQQQKDEIKLHYQRATRAYDLQKYQEAIDEYQKAYEIGGDPPMLYNIGQAYRLNDQPAEAIRYYRRYLQRSPNARNREDVERKIGELEKVIEERKKAAAATTPPPATTAPPATTPTTAPPPVVEGPQLAPQPPPPPPPTVPIEPPPPEHPGRARRVVGWSMIAAGVAAGGAAIYEGLQAKDKGDQLSTLSKNGGTYNPSLQSDGKTANLAAIILGISGGALAVTGAILIITAPSGSTSAEPATPSTALTLTPWLGPGLVGAGAGLNF
jgi:tetratricopeptide (TPR) repeat protein